MVNRSRFMGVAAVTVSLVVLAAFPFRKLEPKVDALQRPKEAHVLFLPIYNAAQPNKIDLRATGELKTWMKKNGFEGGKISDLKKTMEMLNGKMHGEKDMPIDAFSKVFLSEVVADQRGTVTAGDFMNLKAPGCLEKSAAVASALLDMGIDAEIFMVKHTLNGETSGVHIFVVAQMELGKMMLDPFYGITETDLARYKEKYVAKVEADVGKLPDGTEIAIYPLPEFVAEYEQYKNEKEREVEGAVPVRRTASVN